MIANMLSVLMYIFVALVSDEVLSKATPNLVILSFDGLHPKHINETQTPDIYKLRTKSSRPGSLRTIFPAQSFVTHFSVSTGLLPYEHEVYGNKMFDKKGNVISDTREHFQSNSSIVPIWIENQKAGNGRHSGVMNWPGTKLTYGTDSPTHFHYDTKTEWNVRATKIVEWMSNKTQKANLVMAYFENPLRQYRYNQPTKLADHIKKINDTFSQIYDGLKDLNLEGGFNIIIMSDHGTQTITHNGVLFIEDIIGEENAEFKTITSGPIVYIKAENIEVYGKLREKIVLSDALQTKFELKTYNSFKKHYWNTQKSPHLKLVLTLVAEPGYTFYKKTEFENIAKVIGKANFVKQENGYDNREPQMNAFFMGTGKRFNEGVNLEDEFSLIEVHPILKSLLNLSKPDGRKKNYLSAAVREMLKDEI